MILKTGIIKVAGKIVVLLLLGFIAGNTQGLSQTAVNYDESLVDAYISPDPLISQNGKKIKTVKKWERSQRPYILSLFKENIYGKLPGKPQAMHYQLLEMNNNALDGKAIRKQVKIYFLKNDSNAALNLILYFPKTQKPVPVFIGLNFLSNPSISEDPAILPSLYTLKKNGIPVVVKRGEQSRRWPLSEIIDAGFGVATAYYQDIEPDDPLVKTGIRYSMQTELNTPPGEWGAIGAWAWGLSRIQDYLEKEPLADAKRTIVTGHSRLGKAALWAGANDSRFAMVISNNSGEGGAALARRNYGETIDILNNSFPHWFIDKYNAYNSYPEKLPVDQHELLALIAPRPLYIASAEDDKWADPKGEFLSARSADPVYHLYKKNGLERDEMPGVNNPVGETIRYHIRTGKHDIILYDWLQYIDFARRKLIQHNE